MIIESKPLHKKKKRLAKSRSEGGGTPPDSPNPVQEALDRMEKEFKVYNREELLKNEEERIRKLEVSESMQEYMWICVKRGFVMRILPFCPPPPPPPAQSYKPCGTRTNCFQANERFQANIACKPVAGSNGIVKKFILLSKI